MCSPVYVLHALCALRSSPTWRVESTIVYSLRADCVGKIITHLACGEYHTVAATTEGELWTWGSNRYHTIHYTIHYTIHDRAVGVVLCLPYCMPYAKPYSISHTIHSLHTPYSISHTIHPLHTPYTIHTHCTHHTHSLYTHTHSLHTWGVNGQQLRRVRSGTCPDARLGTVPGGLRECVLQCGYGTR
jgi:hypothetical protein